MGDGCLNNEHFEELGGILKAKLEEHFKNQELRQVKRQDEDYDEQVEESLQDEVSQAFRTALPWRCTWGVLHAPVLVHLPSYLGEESGVYRISLLKWTGLWVWIFLLFFILVVFEPSGYQGSLIACCLQTSFAFSGSFPHSVVGCSEWLLAVRGSWP